jgi:cytochrome c oxidase cbb3-type subunit III
MFFAFAWSCDSLPGKPKASQVPLAPTEIKEFAPLYADNCAGCHGTDGSFGAATQLNNPLYLAIVDDASLQHAITQGVPGTSMPPFAISEGGSLTDDQIAILIRGMRQWPRLQTTDSSIPSYSAHVPGDADRGARVYSTFCESCHGPNGQGGSKAGSIVDVWYLSLTSNQSIRTLIIAGRTDLAHPDWRDYVDGKPLSEEEITDLVGWLTAKRPQQTVTVKQ